MPWGHCYGCYVSEKAATYQVVDHYENLMTASRADNDEVILRSARHLLDYATQNSGWWRLRVKRDFGNLNATQSLESFFAEIPIMRRADLQAWSTLMRIVSKNAAKGTYVPFKTSGSTGRPVSGVVFGPLYFLSQAAIAILQWRTLKLDPSKNMAYIRVNGKIADEEPYTAPVAFLENATGHTWTRSSTSQSISELLQFIEETKPDYVFVNGVTMRLIAKLAKHKNSAARFSKFFAVSDKTDANLRREISETFGADTIDVYSSEEFGMLAIQCPSSDHLHVVEPVNYIELLDENNQPVKPGEPGRVVITSLNSLAQPMIRYEIGDIAKWDPVPCPAGITWGALQEISGRIRDSVIDENGEPRLVTLVGAEWQTWSKLLDQHILRFADAIVILVDLADELTSAEEIKLKDSLKNIFYTRDRVEIVRTQLIDVMSSVKRREFTAIAENAPSSLRIENLLTFISHSSS